MSLSAVRFQTRHVALDRLAIKDLSEGGSLHSRKVGLNTSLQELGLSHSTINDLIDWYGVNVARSLSRVGHEFKNFYDVEPNIPNLAELIFRFGENYTRRDVVDKGNDPYEVLVSPKKH